MNAIVNRNRLRYNGLQGSLESGAIGGLFESTICACRKTALVPKIVQSPVGFTQPGVGADMKLRRTRRGDAGFTLIDMLFVVALIGLLASLAIPGFMKARGAAQASSAIGTLRVVNSGELSFAITCGLGFYSPDLPTLGVPPPGSIEPFLNDDMTAGMTFVKSGYNFSLAGTGLAGAPASCNGLAIGQASPGYAAVADPLDPSITRFFGTNADGVTYQHTATFSATMPETGPPPVGTAIQ
jgi:prepilin-type N-terminal cleavage/methylation domain-containing protein